jgi:HEAT repeat protein
MRGGRAGLRSQRSSFLVFAHAVVFLGLAALPAAAELELNVTVRHGWLTVNVRDATLGDVLNTISKEAGVRIVIHGEVDPKVTDTFMGVTLDEGIRRLVRGRPLALLYTVPAGTTEPPRLAEVHVYGATAPADHVARLESHADSARPSVPVPSGTSTGEVSQRHVRLRAVRSLAQPGNAAGVTALAQALSTDPDPGVRAAAAIALGTVGGAQALAALSEAIRDENTQVRLRVVDALGKFEAAAGAALDEIRRGDPQPQVRERATKALAGFGRAR